MKLAYLAYDQNSNKTHSTLFHEMRQLKEIDSYLVHRQDFPIDDVQIDLLSLPIMTQNILIPSDEAMQTQQHKLILKEIMPEYNFLKYNIFSKYKLSNKLTDKLVDRTSQDDGMLNQQEDRSKNNLDAETEVNEAANDSKSEPKLIQSFNLSDVNRIFFNKKINKFIFESSNQAVHSESKTDEEGLKNSKEYDYVFVEAHQVVSDLLHKKEQNIMDRPQIQTHIVLNLEYPVQYKFAEHHLHHEFIFVENTHLKTIFDNWFLCFFSQNKLNIRLFIPYGKHQDIDYLNFITRRSFVMLQRSFEAFEVKELQKRWISTADGFFSQELKLRYLKKSRNCPSFTFWPQYKINNFTKSMVESLKKKNKRAFTEREI